MGDDARQILHADPRQAVNRIDTAGDPDGLKPIWNKMPETASRLRGRIEAVLTPLRSMAGSTGRESGAVEKLARPQLAPPYSASSTEDRRAVKRGSHAAMPYAEVPGFMERLKDAPGVAALALRFTILTAREPAKPSARM